MKLNAESGSKIFVNGQEFDAKTLKGLGFNVGAEDFPIERLQFDADKKMTSYEYDQKRWNANDGKATYDVKDGVLTITSTDGAMSMKILSMEQNSCMLDASMFVESMMKDYKLTEKFDVQSARLKVKRIS